MHLKADELKERFAGTVFDSVEVHAGRQEMLDFALACGESDPRYTDPDHPDFQAPINFAAHYHGARMLPDDFPDFDKRAMIDAGKAVEWRAPIRPDTELVASSRLHDIYEKTGRSGSMIFLVHRMEFQDPEGELKSIVDWRLLLRGDLL